MAPELAHLLPLPGPVWGRYPQRPHDDSAAPWRRPRWGSAGAQCRQVASAAARAVTTWPPREPDTLSTLRRALRRDGLQPATTAQALAVVAACAAHTLGWTPRQTQVLAAAALLGNRMAEMATGEGKTLAVALAAAVAALAGMPVHVVTANEYLAARDAERLAPLFRSLGLRVAALPAAGDEAARRAVYGHDIVYATAKALAFDYLRDRQLLARADEGQRHALALAEGCPPAPMMRGLCMALLDEADSILLDEADVPLILSQQVPHAARRAFLWQALALARQLAPGRDFSLQPAERSASLTAAGEDQLAALAHGLGGPWQRQRYRREAVQMALAGLHTCLRNQHYLVRDGAIELLDEVTGRVAAGRVWSRGLHTVVAMKEGLSPPPETETVSQITFQRFFQRYWRLCGISGTLWEARGELRAVYGATVVRIPLHRPCRRRTLPPRCFADAPSMFEAAAERAAALQAAGRPVLLGTDSVADSLALSACLARRGIGHRVLDALHDADEAAIVADAGRAGRVTVATRMAGRGTDIVLDDAARAAGGLHVLSCQDNPSRRLDRQLAGRAGRQGDPGSTEAWISNRHCGKVSLPPADNPVSINPQAKSKRPSWTQSMSRNWQQWREERRRCAVRRHLLEHELHWERRLAFAGPPA